MSGTQGCQNFAPALLHVKSRFITIVNKMRFVPLPKLLHGGGEKAEVPLYCPFPPEDHPLAVKYVRRPYWEFSQVPPREPKPPLLTQWWRDVIWAPLPPHHIGACQEPLFGERVPMPAATSTRHRTMPSSLNNFSLPSHFLRIFYYKFAFCIPCFSFYVRNCRNLFT